MQDELKIDPEFYFIQQFRKLIYVSSLRLYEGVIYYFIYFFIKRGKDVLTHESRNITTNRRNSLGFCYRPGSGSQPSFLASRIIPSAIQTSTRRKLGKQSRRFRDTSSWNEQVRSFNPRRYDDDNYPEGRVS